MRRFGALHRRQHGVFGGAELAAPVRQLLLHARGLARSVDGAIVEALVQCSNGAVQPLDGFLPVADRRLAGRVPRPCARQCSACGGEGRLVGQLGLERTDADAARLELRVGGLEGQQ